jgi:hypothetical protein
MKFLIMLLIPISAQAHCGMDHDDQELGQRVHECHGTQGNHEFNPKFKKPVLTTVTCGQVITSSITLANDLNCSTYGFALIVEGDKIKVNGNGHSITAPNALAGIYVQGSDIIVNNLTVRGILSGAGMLGYDTSDVVISGNNFSNNQIGISFFNENVDAGTIILYDNIANHNSLFGLRISYDENGSVDKEPGIVGNDFSNSGSYGMQLKMSSFEIDDTYDNDLKGSSNGLYLATGNFNLHDFSLANSGVKNIGIFVDSANNVSVSRVDLSNHLPADSNQRRLGIDMYRCKHFSVSDSIFLGDDAGVKLETEMGVSPTGSITCSLFDDVVAGVEVVSYDGTPYGQLVVQNNRFQNSCKVPEVLVIPGTVIGVNSSIQRQ